MSFLKKTGIAKIFALVALAWAGFSLALCLLFRESGSSNSTLSFILFWALCLTDLWVLSKAVKAALTAAAEAANGTETPSQNSGIAVIQAFAWGAIKLVCLGFFTLAIFIGKPAVNLGFLLGMATLLVVPVFGGLLIGGLKSELIKSDPESEMQSGKGAARA